MMPDFAKGWEKDGWRIAFRGDNKVEKDFEFDSQGEGIRAVIYKNGLLALVEIEGGVELDEVQIPYGDPLIAKRVAEQMMEGLK